MKRSIIDLIEPGIKVVFKDSKFTINSNNEKIVFTVDSIDKKHNATNVYVPIQITSSSFVYTKSNSFVFNLNNIEAIVKEPSDSDYKLFIGDRLKIKNDSTAYALKDKEAEIPGFIRDGSSDDYTMIQINNDSYEISKDIIAYKILYKHDDIFPSKGDTVLLSEDLKYTEFHYGLVEEMEHAKGAMVTIVDIGNDNKCIIREIDGYNKVTEYSYHHRDIVRIVITDNSNNISTIEHLISYY